MRGSPYSPSIFVPGAAQHLDMGAIMAIIEDSSFAGCLLTRKRTLTHKTAMAKKLDFDMELVKKYLFWVGTPIALVVALLAGLMAIGSVAGELERQKTALENQKTATQSLRSTASTHPNQETISAINDERRRLAENVLAAWEIMVEAQQEQNVWEGLAAADINEIRSKNFLDTLSSSVLNSYLNFAQNHINQLLDKPSNDIRRVEHRDSRTGRSREQHTLVSAAGGRSGRQTAASWERSSAAPSGLGARTVVDANSVMRGKVVWNTPLLDITMRDWTQQPLSYEIWLTQEDLWVYQALLWVIAESNKNAPENSVPFGAAGGAASVRGGGGTGATGGQLLDLSGSVIKEIVELHIGRPAAIQLASQSRRRIGSGAAGGTDEFSSSSSFGSSSSGSGFGSSSSSSDTSMGGSAALTPEALQSEALTGRYVDAVGSPLMTPDMTGQLRRMPVYLRLVVDQNRIPEVLVNCANCPMPIDVLWVTINPDAGQSFDFASAMGTSTGMSGSSDSSGSGFATRPPRSTRPQGGGSTGTRTGASGVDYGPNALTIEIFGCINIFSPPDIETLGGGME